MLQSAPRRLRWEIRLSTPARRFADAVTKKADQMSDADAEKRPADDEDGGDDPLRPKKKSKRQRAAAKKREESGV